MSSARRLLVLLGFALMVAGILLLVTQEEEIFVALSVLGFVVVVAAVPRLERERSEAGAEPATAVRPASGVGQRAGAQPGTGNVTAIPSEPTREQPAVTDPETAGDGQQPSPEPPSEPPPPSPPAALEPAPPAPPVAAPAPPEPEPAEPAEREPAEPQPEPAEPEPAPSFAAPERWGSWEAQAPPPAGPSASGPGRPSTRTIAVAGTAAAAMAALWAWRRRR